MDLHRILVPTDFSRCSKQALSRAEELARRFGAKVDLLFVWDLPSFFSFEMTFAFPGQNGRSMEEILQENGRRQLDELARTAIPNVVGETIIVRGEPWREIASQAKRGHYDLIVMGTHGASGIDRVFIGRVTERVIQHAPCPVLSVRNHSNLNREA